MITNNFNKELRGISDALRDLGYTDSTIGPVSYTHLANLPVHLQNGHQDSPHARQQQQRRG